jgi:hypothetical protein
MRRAELEQQVHELDAQIAALRARNRLPPNGIRRRAAWSIGSMPLYEISLGSDLGRRQMRGHARGVIAVGDRASGVLAIGGYARGVVAIGGIATGIISVGGLSLGLLSALGGLAIGALAVGGTSVGGIAIGGSRIGYDVCDAVLAGTHIVSTVLLSPDAAAFFARLGLDGFCSRP